MFEKIKRIWNKYGFEIMIGGSILFIFFYWLICRRGKIGSFDLQYEYGPPKTNIKKKSKDSKGETKCRDVLERIYNKPFSKIRPKFLFNNKTGKNMELDMFNKDLLIACEYNGQQHYNYIPFFHRTEDGFQKQKDRDEQKRSVCKKLGIFLIEVPYTISENKIDEFIRDKLIKNNKL